MSEWAGKYISSVWRWKALIVNAFIKFLKTQCVSIYSYFRLMVSKRERERERERDMGCNVPEQI